MCGIREGTLILLANPIFRKVNENAIPGNFVSLNGKRDSHMRGIVPGRRRVYGLQLFPNEAVVGARGQLFGLRLHEFPLPDIDFL